MLEDIGYRFDRVLPALAHVRDLEAFEGPILSELRAKSGRGLYVEKWCARDASTTRTLVVRTDQRAIAEYLAGRRAMLSLLTEPNDGVGFLVDYERGERRAVRLVVVDGLPDKYLPKPYAMHDPTLRPESDTSTQMFFFDADWNAKLLAQLEKRYLDVYAMTYFTDPKDQRERLPALFLQYNYDSGYTYGRVFEALRRRVPANENARSVGVAAASPGVMTIEAPSGTADRVAHAVTASARPEVKKAYEALQSWARVRGRHKDKREAVPVTALADVRRLCNLLGIAVEKVVSESWLTNDGDPLELLASAKLVAAHYRKLWALRSPRDEGVQFVAAGVEPLPDIEGVEPPEDVDEDDEDDDLM